MCALRGPTPAELEDTLDGLLPSTGDLRYCPQQTAPPRPLQPTGRARPQRQVVRWRTHTKQLQSQLANEVAELAAGVPGLLDTIDVVKGAGNRLSLRGLIYTLADASGADVGSAAAVIR